MSDVDDERVYCEYDTSFFMDGEDYILAFCEESDMESGCGWMSRAVNNAPRQASGLAIMEFRQLDELNGLHKTSWRTPEQIENIRLRAEQLRQQHCRGQ